MQRNDMRVLLDQGGPRCVQALDHRVLRLQVLVGTLLQVVVCADEEDVRTRRVLLHRAQPEGDLLDL